MKNVNIKINLELSKDMYNNKTMNYQKICIIIKQCF